MTYPWRYMDVLQLSGLLAGDVKESRNDMFTAHENLSSLQEEIWIQLTRFFKEFGQPLLVAKLQSDPVVFESKLLGKTSSRFLDLSIVQVHKRRGYHSTLN